MQERFVLDAIVFICRVFDEAETNVNQQYIWRNMTLDPTYTHYSSKLKSNLKK